MADDENVKVFCRVRPPNERECGAAVDSALGGSAGYFARARMETARARKCVTVPASDAQQQTVVLQNRHGVSRQFTFDRVFGEASSQTDVFQAVGAPITRACLEGYNGTIFAYGQTGSGKTFTMQGPDDVIDAESHVLAAEELALRGLVPRVFDFLFENVAGSTPSNDASGVTVQHTFSCSFLEIYNERVYDLLDGGSTKDTAGLQLRESGRKGVVVDGLIESEVTSARQAADLMKIGTQNRRVGQTTMNRESSRSHSVFILQIQSQEISSEGTKTRLSRFNLVDLAGSERQRSTETAGERLKEAGSINKSLSALGNVIMGLVDQSAGKSRHVHYRDSKLTFLLKDSLGGNSKTFMIATISPAEDSSFETLSTLKFAQRAKLIRNNAVINEDSSGSNYYLQQEVARLRRELEQAKADSGRQGWNPSIGHVLMNPASLPPDQSTEQQLDLGSDHAVALRIRELEEALACTLEKSDQLERSCDRLLVREEHLESLCAELKKTILQLKLMLKLRGDQRKNDVNEYIPSVDAVEWRIKYEELEEEFVRLQDEFARCQPTGGAAGMSRSEVQSEVESLNILLMALTRQLALVVRDKHDLQDRLEGKRSSEDSSMDDESPSEGSWDFSIRLEEALKQQAHDFESRISSLQCEAQIMEEKTAEASLELLQMKQREAAYKIQLSDADAQISALNASLSNAEQEREEARTMSIQHQVRIEDLSLQIERVKESVQLEFEQQVIDSRLANDSLTTKVKQLENQVAQLLLSQQQLEVHSAELQARLDSKHNECSALSSQLEYQVAENKHACVTMEQLKAESTAREATLTKSIEETAAITKKKEQELHASRKKVEELELLSHEKSQKIADITRQLEGAESALNEAAAAKCETEVRARLLDEAVVTLQQEKRVAWEELESLKLRYTESEERRQAAATSLTSTTEHLVALEKTNAALASDLDAATGQLEEVRRFADKLQGDLDAMERMAKKLEVSGATLKRENIELAASVGQANSLIETLREEAAVAASSHDELVARTIANNRSETEVLVKEYEQRLSLKDDQLAVLGTEVQEIKQRFQELQAAEQEVRAINNQLRGDMNQLQADATETQANQDRAYSSMKSELEREIQSIGQQAASDAARFDRDRMEFDQQRALLESQMEERANAQEMIIEALTTEVDQLKQTLTSRTDAVEKEAGANSTLRERVDVLTSELAEASQQLENARDSMAQLKIQLIETERSSAEQIEALTEEVATRSQSIACLSAENDTKVGEVAGLKARCEQQLATIERLSIDMENAKSERATLDKALSTDLREAKSESAELRAQLDQQISIVKKLESANAVLKEALQSEMVKEQAAEESFAREKSQWEEERQSLVHKSEAKQEAMQIEILSGKKTIDAMTARMNQLEEQVGVAKSEVIEKADAVSKLQEEVKTLTQTLERSADQQEHAEAQWSQERRALAEEVDASKQDSEASKKSMADMQSRMEALEQASRETNSKLEGKTEAVSKLRSELEGLQKAHKAGMAENERLRGQQQSKSDLVAQETDLKRRKGELALTEASIRSTMKGLEKRSASIASMELELKSLRCELAQSKQRVKMLDAANRQLTMEKKRLDSEAIDLRNKFERVSNENDKLVSHHNTRQKIQYHIRVKEQNNELLEQVRYLTNDKSRLERMVERMRAKEKEKENLSDNSVGKPRASLAPPTSLSTSTKSRARMLGVSPSDPATSTRISGGSSNQSKSPRATKRARTRED